MGFDSIRVKGALSAVSAGLAWASGWLAAECRATKTLSFLGQLERREKKRECSASSLPRLMKCMRSSRRVSTLARRLRWSRSSARYCLLDMRSTGKCHPHTCKTSQADDRPLDKRNPKMKKCKFPSLSFSSMLSTPGIVDLDETFDPFDEILSTASTGSLLPLVTVALLQWNFVEVRIHPKRLSGRFTLRKQSVRSNDQNQRSEDRRRAANANDEGEIGRRFSRRVQRRAIQRQWTIDGRGRRDHQ